MQLSQIQNFEMAFILNLLTKNGNSQKQKTQLKHVFLENFIFNLSSPKKVRDG